MNNSIEAELMEILNGYVVETKNALDEDLKKAAQTARKEVRKNSPTKSGKYKKGWTYKKTENGWIVYNASQPWKTHLLENGHAKRGGGRVKAIKHIKPAAEMAINQLLKDIKTDL